MRFAEHQEKQQNSISLIRLARVRKENPAGNNTFFNI